MEIPILLNYLLRACLYIARRQADTQRQAKLKSQIIKNPVGFSCKSISKEKPISAKSQGFQLNICISFPLHISSLKNHFPDFPGKIGSNSQG